jgi:hypothetical protein
MVRVKLSAKNPYPLLPVPQTTSTVPALFGVAGFSFARLAGFWENGLLMMNQG